MDEGTQDVYRLLMEIYLMLDDGDRRVLRAFDLTNRQYHTLVHLAPGTRRNLTELADLLICDKSNVTGLVERLVRDGMLQRRRSRRDRRYLEVQLTEKSTVVREQAMQSHARSVQERFSGLTPEEIGTLESLLAKLASTLRTQLDAAE